MLETEPTACIYAGLKSGVNAVDLTGAAATHTLPEQLASLTPKVGDGIFIHSGTVHSLGGVVVFEIQENSDVTFRLYDWDHVDTKTGQPRELQLDQALACIDFDKGPVHAVIPITESRSPCLTEKLFDCEHFVLWRRRAKGRFTVGALFQPRILVNISGAGRVEFAGVDYPLDKGEVMLLPAAMGPSVFQALGEVVILEIAVPSAK